MFSSRRWSVNSDSRRCDRCTAGSWWAVAGVVVWLTLSLVSPPLRAQSTPVSPAPTAPPAPVELKERLLAAEGELARVRAENARLKENLQQMTLEIVNLNAQIRIIEKDTDKGRATATPVASGSASPRGGSSEGVEELKRQIEVLRRTVDLLTQENRRQAGKGVEANPAPVEQAPPKAQSSGR